MARSYVIGLPVIVTVHEDGTVSAEVDLSECDDLHEATEDSESPAYTSAEVDADIATVGAAIRAKTISVEHF